MEREQLVYLENTDEYYDVKHGISFYSGDVIPDWDEAYSELWLPQATLETYDLLMREGAVTIRGAVGGGKSALIFGNRTVLRTTGTPYVFIDGHYKSTPADVICEAIELAHENNIPVLYDSADYLAGANKKVRSMSLKKHIPRNIAILETLLEFRNQNGLLLMTSHRNTWINDLADDTLLPLWNDLISTTYVHDIDIRLDDVQSRFTLLEKLNLDYEIAAYLATIPENPGFINYLTHSTGDKKRVKQILEGLRTYQILKVLGIDNYEENIHVLEAIQDVVSGQGEEENCWKLLHDFVDSKIYRLLFFTKL